MIQIKVTPETPAVLSRQLRRGSGGYLAQRRGIAGLSLFAVSTMGLIGLYQMGIIKHLPEPSSPIFDSDRIDASDESYSLFSTPDAILGVGNYAATMALAAMGGEDRAREAPWLSLLFAVKVGFDVAQGIRLTIQQWMHYRAFCFWCVAAALASFAEAPLVIPEAQAALRYMRSRRWSRTH